MLNPIITDAQMDKSARSITDTLKLKDHYHIVTEEQTLMYFETSASLERNLPFAPSRLTNEVPCKTCIYILNLHTINSCLYFDFHIVTLFSFIFNLDTVYPKKVTWKKFHVQECHRVSLVNLRRGIVLHQFGASTDSTT